MNHRPYSFFVALTKILSVFLLLSYSISSLAYTPSEGNISTYFGPYLYKTDFDSSASGAKSPTLGGLGWVVLGDSSDSGSLEVGVFYLNKYYYRNYQGNELAEQTALYHVTMGYRWWFTPYFSASLSFFSDYSAGDVQIVHTNMADPALMNTSARDTAEYGFDIALQTDLWNQGRWAAVLDARYSLSVTGKEGESANNFGAVIGLRYLIQEKENPMSESKQSNP